MGVIEGSIAAVATWLATPLITAGTVTLLTVGNVVAFTAMAGLAAASNYFQQQEAAKRRAGLAAELGSMGVGPMASGASQASRSTIAMMPYVLGEAPVSGIVFFESTDRPPFYHLGFTLAAHEIDSVTGIEINGVRVAWDASGNVTTAPYAVGTRSLVRVSIRLGKTDQLADPILLGDFPSLGSEYRQRGRATLVIRFDYGIDEAEHQRVWEGGVKVRTFVRGLKVFDPNDATQSVNDAATWRWTDSPALLAAHIARLPDFGRRRADQIRYDLVAASARIDAEGVPDGSGGITRRYRANGVVDTSATALSVLRDLMVCNRGRVTNDGLGLGILSGGWTDPVMTLHDAMLGPGAVSYEAEGPRDRLCNEVRTRIIRSDREWQSGDGPILVETALQALDGQPFPATLDAPLVNDPALARRLAHAYLKDVRLGRSLTVPCGPEAMLLEVGDVVTAAFASMPWVNGLYQVENVEEDGEGEVSIVSLVEASSDVWFYDPARDAALFVDPETRPQ